MISPQETSVLLRLILAHLLTDFIFQPLSWVRDRREKKYLSKKLYLHALTTAVVAYILSGLWGAWWLPLIIFISHLFIDIWKSYQPNRLKYFIIDQLLHLFIIGFIWIGVFNKWQSVTSILPQLFHSNTLLIVLTGYIIIAWPLGILIGIATEKWRLQSSVNTDGLAKAGLWIGLFERFLILTSILTGQYTAIGFLIAAKSVLRFNDKENTQKKTEYVLIGTLLSFSACVLLGVVMILAMRFI